MMWAKVVFVTGAKNKTRLTETNSKRLAFHGQKARHLELEEKLCDYMNDKRQYGCAVTSEMCQLKALAVNNKPGNSGSKATLGLCQVAAGKLVLIWLAAGICMAQHGNGQPSKAPTCHASLYLCETCCSCNVHAD